MPDTQSEMPAQEARRVRPTVLADAPRACVFSAFALLVPVPQFRPWPFSAHMFLLFGMPVSAGVNYTESVNVWVWLGFAWLCFQGRIVPSWVPCGPKANTPGAVPLTAPRWGCFS